MIKICPFCGKKFEASHDGQIYCSSLCSGRQRKKLFHLRNFMSMPDKSLDDWAREAAECGMDYGTYRALIEHGKTFDELKADADRSKAAHSHVGHLSSSRHGWRLS